MMRCCGGITGLEQTRTEQKQVQTPFLCFKWRTLQLFWQQRESRMRNLAGYLGALFIKSYRKSLGFIGRMTEACGLSPGCTRSSDGKLLKERAIGTIYRQEH